MPNDPTGGERLAAWRDRVPRPVRLLAPVLLMVPALVGPEGIGRSRLDGGWTAGLVVAAAGVVVLRRRCPRLALAAALLLAVAGMALHGPFLALLAALVVVVFSVARHTDRRTAALSTLVAGLVAATTAALTLGQDWGVLRSFGQVAAFLAFAGAAGDGSRSRVAYIEAITERARRAEESKESEARSRVAEERLRIAQDLHDVMAHQIAVINLHAGVASQAVRERPADAERSLLTIREAARTVLGETQSLLQVLRSAEAGSRTDRPVAAPVPGLADVDRLVADFARGGLRVDVRRIGQPVALPQEVDIVAYQVIQEGLTNAQKHGLDGSALLQVEYGGDLLELTVTNLVARRAEQGRDAGGGHGLVGARERVASVRGRLDTADTPGPVYRLTAKLPLGAPAAGTTAVPELRGSAPKPGAAT